MPQVIEVPGYGNVEFPDGMSHEEIAAAIEKNIIKTPDNNPGVFGRIRRGFMRTGEGFLSSAQTAYESEFTDKPIEEVASRAADRQRKIDQEYPSSLGLDKVEKAYEKDGLLSAAKEVAYQIPEGVGALGASMVGGIAGGLIGGFPGAAAGVAATMGPTFYGSNLERQFEEHIKAGKAIEPDKVAAALGALGQTGAEFVGYIPFGRALIAPFKLLATKSGVAAAEKIAAESVASTLAKGTAVGMLAEIPTEVAQQMIERYQAGLSLTDDEAAREYAETAYQTAISVAPLGGPARMVQRSAAKSQLKKLEGEEENAKNLAVGESEYIANRQKEFADADVERRKQEALEVEEAKQAADAESILKLPAPDPNKGRVATEEDTQALIEGQNVPLERTTATERDGQFMVVTEAGNPVQGGFRTLEEAENASGMFNAKVDEVEQAQAQKDKEEQLTEYVRLANQIRNAGGVPVFFGSPDTGIKSLIFNRRMARQGQPNVLDLNAPFTTAQEIEALELNDNRELTVVKNNKGRIELKSGIPKPDELNLSDRLLQMQEPGIDVANGLTVRQDQTQTQPEPETKGITPAAEKYLDQGQDRNDPTKFRPKVADKVTNQLKSIAKQNGIDLKKTVPVDGVDTVVNKTPQDIVDELVAKRNRPVKMAGVGREAPPQPYGPQNRAPRSAFQIGADKAAQNNVIKTALKAAFDKLGLTKQGVKPEVVNYITDKNGVEQRGAGAVEGEFDPDNKTITFASNIYDPKLSVDEIVQKMKDVLNHEVIHSLKEAGLFTPREWRILENFVKGKDGRKYLERAKLLYPDLDANGQVEEAIAEAARAYVDGTANITGAPRGLIKRIVDFFKALFTASKNANTTPDKIFEAVRSGEIGNRKANPQGGRKMQAKIGEAGTRDWTNLSFMMKTLGRSMYDRDVGNITAKELIQNSFDAIKSAQASGILKGPGKIVYDYNNKDKSITVTDNGIGMNDETIKSAFFTVFGTKKESLSPKDSSGGFGLAKLAYLQAAEDIEVESTKDGVTYFVKTNAEEIDKFYNTRSDIEVEQRPTPNKPNGTKVYVKLPEYVINKDGKRLDTSVEDPDILAQSWRKIIGNVEIYKRESWGTDPEIVQDKSITDLSEFKPPETHKFPWGEVDLYIGKELAQWAKEPVVLSSGIYQFEMWGVQDANGNRPEIKSILNVKSYSTPAGLTMEQFAGEENPSSEQRITGYPFHQSRERFEKFVENDIKKLSDIVLRESALYKVAENVKKMKSFYIMRPNQKSVNEKFKKFSGPKVGGVVFDKVDVGLSDADIENRNFSGNKKSFPSDYVYFHNNLNLDIIEEAASKHGIDKDRAGEFFYEIGKVMHDLAFEKMNAISYLDDKYKAFQTGEEARVVGISLDKNYGGVSIVVPLHGMFINPLAEDSSLKGKIDSYGIAAEWLRVMMHEAAHELQRSHNANFANEEIRLYTLFRQSEANDPNLVKLSQLEDRLVDIHIKYQKEHEALVNVFNDRNTQNFAKSISGENRQDQPVEKGTGVGYGQSVRPDAENTGRREDQPAGQGISQGGVRNPEVSQERDGTVPNEGVLPEEAGRNVKQSRIGLSPTVINFNLPPQQQQTSNQITQSLVNINQNLAKLTADEGIRMSKTYKDYIKEFFNPYHMLGKGADKFRIARALMTGEISTLTERVNEIVADIGAAKADKFAISRYLTDPVGNPNTIKDAKARQAAIKTKSLINQIGDELVSRKLITQAERDKLRDQYLPRVLLAYANKKKFVTGGHKPGFMYYIKSREDLTPDQRTALGEIEDPAFLVQEALFAPIRDLSILNYFDKLNQIGGGSWILGMDKVKYQNTAGSTVNLSLPELKTFAINLQKQLDNGEIAPDRIANTHAEINNIRSFVEKREADLKANVDEGRYVQVPKDSDRYGPLAGLWVANPIYRDIMGVGSFLPNNMSAFAALFADGTVSAKATSLFKMMKVAANPPTIATNIISNTLMMHMADVPMHRILPRIGSAFKQLVLDRNGKYYELAHRYGLKETTLSEAELKNLYRDLEQRKTGGSDLNKVMNMMYALNDTMKKGGKKISDFYGGIETVFKIAIVIDGIESQGLTEEQAILKANKYLFDYSEVHDSIKVLRNMPFGAPFITWSYKMTPLLIETALTKPWKFIPYAALFYGISSLASMAIMNAGGEEEDKNRLKKLIPKKTAESPMTMVTGPTDVVDVGKFMPFNNMYKFAAAVAKGEPVEAVKSFGFLGGPAADIISFAMTGNDPFTGQKVIPKGATKEEKAAIITNYVANVFMPPFMKDLPQLAWGSMRGNPELVADSQSIVADALKKVFDGPSGKQAGLPVKSSWDLAKNFIGINTYHPAILQFQRNILGMQREINEIQTEMNSSLKDPSLSAGEKKKIVEKYSEMILKKKKEIAEYVKDSNLSPSIYRAVQESVTGSR